MELIVGTKVTVPYLTGEGWVIDSSDSEGIIRGVRCVAVERKNTDTGDVGPLMVPAADVTVLQ